MSQASVAISDADDRQLVGLAAEGNGMAFAELVQRHYERAVRVAFGMLKNRADAEDVVQDAFAKVHGKLGTFKGDAKFYTWLYRIVVNKSIDHMRKVKRRRLANVEDEETRDALRSSEGLHPGPDASPSAMTERKKLSQALGEALGTLSEGHRSVLVLREIEGMSYEEIADALKIKKGTVMSRLFHARKAMQQELSRRGLGPGSSEGDAS